MSFLDVLLCFSRRKNAQNVHLRKHCDILENEILKMSEDPDEIPHNVILIILKYETVHLIL